MRDRRKRWFYRSHCTRNNPQYMSRIPVDFLLLYLSFSLMYFQKRNVFIPGEIRKHLKKES